MDLILLLPLKADWHRGAPRSHVPIISADDKTAIVETAERRRSPQDKIGKFYHAFDKQQLGGSLSFFSTCQEGIAKNATFKSLGKH